MIRDTSVSGGSLPVSGRRRIDDACDAFEAAWRDGAIPDLADYLREAAGPERDHLFRELLALDIEFRVDKGDPPDPAHYRDRFPEQLPAIENAFATRVPDDETAPASPTPHPGGAVLALREAGYEVIGELGRGGMGVVYKAKQQIPDREVAVKVIRSAEFASESERVRFRNEVEAVARLDHPNIVPVYEFGRSRGLHFFSMKLVQGASLDRRLGEFTNDPQAAARLVAEIAGAIHHAHQRAVLHRDLKPANILVDERGRPFVTDFGLARRLDVEGGQTHSGAVVGTPSYMSPEQAEGCRSPITTAADVYGLGAILYALLTGRAPHIGDSLASTLDLVRETRADSPSKHNPRVDRDLDVICLKCLEKDPSRRYSGALELKEDLERRLEGRPIAARPVGTAARLAMWGRRHPLPASLAALLLASLVLGFAGVAWQWRVASNNWKRSEAVKDVLVKALARGAATDGSTMTVRELLDTASYDVAGRFQGLPDLEAAVRETVAGAYHSLGEYHKALPHREAALKRDIEAFGIHHPATLRAENGLAATLAGLGKTTEAEVLLRENMDTSTRSLGRDHPVTLEAEETLAGVLQSIGKPSEAETLLKHVLSARRRLFPEHDPEILRALRRLCQSLVDQKRLDEAEPLAVEYEHGVRCTFGPKDHENIDALTNRGLIRELQGRLDEARAFYESAANEARRLLGPDHPRTLLAESKLKREAKP